MSSDMTSGDTTSGDIVPVGDPVQVANEFSLVRIQKVHTRNGERLEISAPKLGHQIILDPMQLESITWQPVERFTEFLETPFGPVEL